MNVVSGKCRELLRRELSSVLKYLVHTLVATDREWSLHEKYVDIRGDYHEFKLEYRNINDVAKLRVEYRVDADVYRNNRVRGEVVLDVERSGGKLKIKARCRGNSCRRVIKMLCSYLLHLVP